MPAPNDLVLVNTGQMAISFKPSQFISASCFASGNSYVDVKIINQNHLILAPDVPAQVAFVTAVYTAVNAYYTAVNA